MVNTLRQNKRWYSQKIVENINNIISSLEPVNKWTVPLPLGNSCCMSTIPKSTEYFDFLINKNKGIEELNNKITELKDINVELLKNNNKTWHLIKTEKPFKRAHTVIELNFEINDQNKNEFFLKYVSEGINKGKTRIFNEYGRDIMSNQMKNDISNRGYTDDEYISLVREIQKNNMIELDKYLDIDYSNVEQIKTNFDDLINNNSGLQKDEFFVGFVNKLYELWDSETPRSKIDKHWYRLSSQIAVEINNLVDKIGTSDVKDLRYMLLNIGEYTNIFEENTETMNNVEAINIKYKMKEDFFK